MKTRRQCKILELVQSREVETQEDLMGLLRESGFNVTQATVSRDIKELRLVKSLDSNGKYRYVSAQQEIPDISSKFYTLFSESVANVDSGQNIVCIKCYNGMAQAVCAAMDSMHWDGVVGTLAGDDTIFVLCRTESATLSLVNELQKLFSVR